MLNKQAAGEFFKTAPFTDHGVETFGLWFTSTDDLVAVVPQNSCNPLLQDRRAQAEALAAALNRGWPGSQKTSRVNHCAGCPGNGIRCSATPSCRLPKLKGWTVVERCDACARYPNDLAAAAAVFHRVKWVSCARGGLHAVGRGPV